MSYLNYDVLMDRAFLSLVQEALRQVQKDGLKGAHHFYITFLTQAPGVIIPEYLREEYPQEMTIVLQHEFWNLKVDSESFSVGLNFNDQDETIVIPFKSIVEFSDPSENFNLEFDPSLAGRSLPPTDTSPLPVTPPQAPATVVSLDQFRKK